MPHLVEQHTTPPLPLHRICMPPSPTPFLCPAFRTHLTHKWGEDLYAAVPPPLFAVQLLVREVGGMPWR